MRRLLVPLSVALASCHHAAPASAAPDGREALRFRWPAGLALDVTATIERTRVQGEEKDDRVEGAQYTLTTSAASGGMRVHAGEVALEHPATGMPTILAQLAFMAWPDFLVGKHGAFTALAEPGAAKAALEPVLAKLTPDQRAAIEARVSDDAIAASVTADWTALVGRWDGVTLAPGQPTTEAGHLPLPTGGGDVATTVHATLKGRVPCDEQTSEARCVQIEVDETLGPAEKETVASAVAAGLPSENGEATKAENVEISYRYVLVTEPDTLVPHAFVSERKLGLDLVSGSARARIEQDDVATREFVVRQGG